MPAVGDEYSRKHVEEMLEVAETTESRTVAAVVAMLRHKAWLLRMMPDLRRAVEAVADEAEAGDWREHLTEGGERES